MFRHPYALPFALLAAIFAVAGLRRDAAWDAPSAELSASPGDAAAEHAPRLFSTPSSLSRLTAGDSLTNSTESDVSAPAVANWNGSPPAGPYPLQRPQPMPLPPTAPLVSDPQPAQVPPQTLELLPPVQPPQQPSPAQPQPAWNQPAAQLQPPTQLATPTPPQAITAASSAPQLPPIDARSGAFQAVERRVREINLRAFGLAERGALYSAKAEFLFALQTAAQACDAQQQTLAYSQSLADGLRALREAGDFAPRHRASRVSGAAEVAAPHETRILPPDSDASLSPLVAMQRYLTHAQEKLAGSTGGLTAAAESLYGLGRVHAWLATQADGGDRLEVPQAMVCQQAALTVNPRHALAANELGVLYARFGQWRQSRDLFRQSVASEMRPEAWRNLAVVHRQLGEEDLARLADDEHRRIVAAAPAARGVGGPVEWVPPQAFAGPSPEQPLARSQPIVKPSAGSDPRLSQQPAVNAQQASSSSWFNPFGVWRR